MNLSATKHISFIFLLLSLFIFSCSNSQSNNDNPTIISTTAINGTYCGYEQSTPANYITNTSGASANFTSESSWDCVAITSNSLMLPDQRRLTANGLPDHEVGVFPNAGNPNTISPQTVSIKMHYSPSTNTAVNHKIIAYALNGVPFDPNTAGTCNDDATAATKSTACNLAAGSGNWNIEAINNTFDFGTDVNNAHVQPDGTYHYHGMPENYITKLLNGATKMVLVGWALDGFPVYAKYGYTDAQDTNSAIKEIKGSYKTKSTPDANRPSVTEFPMGVFQQDWEYVAGSGDLDRCNGRTGVTPDFTSPIYHYYITSTYPYIGRCLKGEVLESGSGGSGPPPEGPPPRR